MPKNEPSAVTSFMPANIARQGEATEGAAPNVVRPIWLSELDQRILALKFAFPAITTMQIAEKLNLPAYKVRQRMKRTEMQDFLAEVQNSLLDEAKDLLIASSLDAVQTLRRIAKGLDRFNKHDASIPVAVQRQAAKDILDILRGYKPEGLESENDLVWETAVSQFGIVVGTKTDMPISRDMPEDARENIEALVEKHQEEGDFEVVLEETEEEE